MHNQNTPTETEIQVWLTSYVATILEISPDEVVIEDTMASHGLDSSAAIGLIADLSTWLNRMVDPEVAYSYPTIESMARYLARGGANGTQTIDHR